MKSVLWLAFAVGCFHLAYASIHFPAAALLMFGYAFGLVRLAGQATLRRAFYFGLAAGFLGCGPQLFFFWHIFGPAAVTLWLVVAFWIGLFTAMVCAANRRWGKAKAVWLVPIIWTGLEYFRSELYYLRFSWLNIGYAFAGLRLNPFLVFGMYGMGFVVMAVAAVLANRARIRPVFLRSFALAIVLLAGLGYLMEGAAIARENAARQWLVLAGVQTEFPSAGILPEVLDRALQKNPDAQVLVLSEYALEGPVPDSLRAWCKLHSRFLVVGGKDPVGDNNYYNTAFVIGTNGETVFRQAKCVPIQFFKDGLPAPRQAVWDSPWGRIGICICYDLSYRRVTDRLMEEGAQLLIVPTMDVEDWGRYEHELHSRVAPVRAQEYGIPIFRLASSGISQAITGGGSIMAETSFPGSLDVLSAEIPLPPRGSLPVDRFLAPACTGITAVLLAVLLLMSGNDRRIAGRK